MIHAARALRLGVMLGCMLESGLGIAAGCCVAPLCDHVDLDGNLLLREDPWPGVELVDGVQDLSAGWKIWTFDVAAQLRAAQIGVVEQLDQRRADLAQVMRRDVGSHAYGDA